MTPHPVSHGLRGVSATLLIALAARAMASVDAPQLGFADPIAQRILDELGVDPRRYELNPREVCAVVLRSQWFLRKMITFFEGHREGLGINFACGLNASFEQVAQAGEGRFKWLDVDLPDVIAIRRRFFPDSSRRRCLARDVTGLRLFEDLGWVPGEPAIIVAEGLLYYLRPEQVEAFFRAAANAAEARQSHLEIIFDYASKLGGRLAGRRPAHQQLGTGYAWTLRRPKDLLRFDPRLEIVEDSNAFLDAMGPFARVFNKVHRIVTGGNLGGCIHLRRSPSPPR